MSKTRIEGKPHYGGDSHLSLFLPTTPGRHRFSAILLGLPRTDTSSLQVTLPTGWSADLPEAVHAHTAFATCYVTFRRARNKRIAERKLVILQSRVAAAYYAKYKSW